MMVIPPTAIPRNLLTHTITVTNYEWTVDAGGMPIRGVVDGVRLVQAAVQPTSAQDSLMYGRDTTKEVFDVFADPLTTIGTSWQVSPTDLVTFNGVSYRVLGTAQDLCSVGVIKKFVIERNA